MRESGDDAPVVWASIAGYCGAAANGGDWSKPGEVTADGFAFDDYRPGDVTEAQCKAGCEAEADCTGYSLSPGRVQGHHDCYLCSKTFTSENENTLNQYQDYTTFKRPTIAAQEPVETVCECIPCGSAVAHYYGGGSCGVASETCSATASLPRHADTSGCYSSASSGCDCRSLTLRGW